MSDLRDYFERHFYSVWANDGGKGPSWFAVADEVIRQMEWARRNCRGNRWEGPPEARRYLLIEEDPLTHAPKDWTP